jgi:hypothetical protein
MGMKTVVGIILKRFGFRKVLAVNAVISALLIGAPACFTATTPSLHRSQIFQTRICELMQARSCRSQKSWLSRRCNRLTEGAEQAPPFLTKRF